MLLKSVIDLLFFPDDGTDVQEFPENAERLAAWTKSRVQVAAPFHGKFIDPVTPFEGFEDDLQFKKEAGSFQPGKKRPGDLSPIDLESALRVRDPAGQSRHPHRRLEK